MIFAEWFSKYAPLSVIILAAIGSIGFFGVGNWRMGVYWGCVSLLNIAITY